MQQLKEKLIFQYFWGVEGDFGVDFDSKNHEISTSLKFYIGRLACLTTPPIPKKSIINALLDPFRLIFLIFERFGTTSFFFEKVDFSRFLGCGGFRGPVPKINFPTFREPVHDETVVFRPFCFFRNLREISRRFRPTDKFWGARIRRGTPWKADMRFSPKIGLLTRNKNNRIHIL